MVRWIMTINKKALSEAQRKKRLTRLSALTEGLIAPALAKKSAYLAQLIAHWPDIAGSIAQWAKPADIHPASSADDDGHLTLSIHSGRGPEALAQEDDIIARVNRYAGFQLITALRLRQDLPLHPEPPGVAHHNQAKQNPAQTQEKGSLQEALDKLGATLAAKSKK